MSDKMSDERTGISVKNSAKRVIGNPDKTKPFRFKPGQSGNPSGRPKKPPQTAIYEELLNDPAFYQHYKNAVKERLLSNRMVGHLEGRELADRLEGKVSQKLNVELNVSLSERLRKAIERADD